MGFASQRLWYKGKTQTFPPLTAAVRNNDGTGLKRIGYAEVIEPSSLVPSLISAVTNFDLTNTTEPSDGYDFFIGGEADAAPKSYTETFPLMHVHTANWTLVGMICERADFKYLRCDPEDHYFLLTEPPLSTPENREYMAEVFSETYNVPIMYIGVQPVLAIVASCSRKDAEIKRTTLSGRSSTLATVSRALFPTTTDTSSAT